MQKGQTKKRTTSENTMTALLLLLSFSAYLTASDDEPTARTANSTSPPYETSKLDSKNAPTTPCVKMERLLRYPFIYNGKQIDNNARIVASGNVVATVVESRLANVISEWLDASIAILWINFCDGQDEGLINGSQCDPRRAAERPQQPDRKHRDCLGTRIYRTVRGKDPISAPLRASVLEAETIVALSKNGER